MRLTPFLDQVQAVEDPFEFGGRVLGQPKAPQFPLHGRLAGEPAARQEFLPLRLDFGDTQGVQPALRPGRPQLRQVEALLGDALHQHGLGDVAGLPFLGQLLVQLLKILAVLSLSQHDLAPALSVLA